MYKMADVLYAALTVFQGYCLQYFLGNFLESRLKSCRSKQDAQDVFAAALNSISDKDPDRDMILQALRQAFGEFVESGEYQRLPDKGEEEEKNRDGRKMLEFVKNESGYQEAYQMNGGRTAFAADA